MGDGSRDLQIPWHEFFGNYFNNETILDVGSALGNSKSRLEKGNNIVTTQEINPKFADRVDITDNITKIKKKYSVVTAFEVLEHTEEYEMDKEIFLKELKRLSKSKIFLTTPNRYVLPSEWHMFPEDFLKLVVDNFDDGYEVKFFCRYGSEIKELSYGEWVNEKVGHQMGILLIKEKNVKPNRSRKTN